MKHLYRSILNMKEISQRKPMTPRSPETKQRFDFTNCYYLLVQYRSDIFIKLKLNYEISECLN